MSIFRQLSRIGLAAGATSVALFAGPAAFAGTTVDYAALGDSYSSGVGTGTVTNDGSGCDRSPDAYGPLWTTAHSVAHFDFAACTGATTSDVVTHQLGGLTGSTTLVSITIGGNDVGFAGVLKSCLLGSDATCQSAVANAENTARTALPRKLATTYSAIRSHAPNARVDVLGYPHLFERTCATSTTMDSAKRGYLNDGADQLDAVVAAAVTGAGAGFAYSDARPHFAGHGICADRPWINDASLLNQGNSYHPNKSGYRSGYLPALEALTG